MTKPATFSYALLLSLALTACGGGGGGSDTTAVTPPSVPQPSVPQPSVPQPDVPQPDVPQPDVPPPSVPPSTVSIPASSYPAGSAELGGYTVLQQARVLCGFGALKQDTRLDAAARNHALYLTSISIASGTSELSHYEDITTNSYYTGFYPWDRTVVTGYGDQVAEILEATAWDYDTRNPPAFPALAQRGADSMRSLLNTVYHLSGAMYEGVDVGFGVDLQTVTTGTTTRREEYRFGSLNGFQASTVTLGRGNMVTYPCQGSTAIPPAFVPANESPNPFPSMTSSSQTVGPPIYLKVDAEVDAVQHVQQVLSVTSSNVSQGGVSVPTTVLTAANDPHKYLGANEVFVIPSNALNPNTTYQVTLAGTINGTPFNRSFAMSTGPE